MGRGGIRNSFIQSISGALPTLRPGSSFITDLLRKPTVGYRNKSLSEKTTQKK